VADSPLTPVELDCRPWRTRHPYPVAIPQARLEAFLEQRLADQGVPVLRGHEVTAIEQDAGGVTAGNIRGSYLIACDGGHSTVRKLLGVPFPGTAGKMSGVVADITLASRSAAVSTAADTSASTSRPPADSSAFCILSRAICTG